MINRDIVASDIPLLLSQKPMKKADITLDLKHDNAIVFGESVKLKAVKSGHYTIPISQSLIIKLSLIILQQE